MRKKVPVIVLLMLFALLVSCGKEQTSEGDYVITLYYVGNAETKVVMREHVLQAATVEGQLEEIREKLTVFPEKIEYIPPLGMGFSLLDYHLENSILYLNVDANYYDLSPVSEILARAAMVRSFAQLREVSYVTITVDGEALHDSLGNLVGMMKADQFIDNAGSEINTYEEVRLKLYFADESGKTLVPTGRNMHYNTNIPMEKLVVEQLIKGVDVTDTGCFPTINPDTKLLNVMVKDGICYVNFDKTFLTPSYNVNPTVTIYSLVNSLTELKYINKVQILIEGETNVNYRESILLTTFFEKNQDLFQDD